MNLFQPPAGLLGDQEEAIRQQMQMQGLLGLAAGLFEAGTPSRTPVSLGGSAIRGLMAGQQMAQGTFDQALKSMQLRQQMEEQKRQRDARERLRTQLAGAVKTVPEGISVGPEQEQALMGQMMFPGETGAPTADVAATRQALLSNVNIPQVKVPDTASQNRAVMEYLMEANPVEYAKMLVKEDKIPEAIRTLEILATRPELLDVKKQIESAGKTEVSLVQKGEEKLFNEVDVPIIKEWSQSASAARKLARDTQTIATLLEGKGGGGLVKLTTDLARDLGFGDEAVGRTVAAQDLANSLATRGAVGIRAAGSGSTSDLEFRAYLQAYPSLSSSEDGRKVMAKYARAFAQREAKLSDYARKLARDRRYSEEAMMQYDESLGPLLGDDFYKLIRVGSTPAGTVDFRERR